jgi:signal transduction histidine kinase
MQQVVWNLLSNAVKFTPERGSVEIGIAADEAYARVVVADNGIGIPADLIPRIFDRFFQVDGSSTRAVGGLGLGLSIVRSIVEMHGGRVWAQSAGQGKGSTFTIELPIADGRLNRAS